MTILPRLSINDVTVTEGTGATVTNRILYFAAGDTTKTISIAISGDLRDELDESFFVNLSAPANVTITDNRLSHCS